MKKYKNSILAIILSLILILFVWHKFLVSGNTVIFILILLGLYTFIKKILDCENKRKCIISIIIGLIFGIIEVICTSINTDYTLNNILFDKWTLVNFLGYSIFGFIITSFVYTIFDKQELTNKTIKLGKLEILGTNKISFFINMLLIFLAWIPYFLRYYPGLLTSDSIVQLSQAIGISELTNHHPIFHTGIIALFVNIGQAISGNLNTGIAFYTIAQMLIMSAIFAFILRYLSKKQVPNIVRIIVLLYYMLYPINALFSVTMWKDVLFAGILPIFIIQCIELIINTENFLSKKKNIVSFIIVSLLVFFARNNGMYVVILTMPFILIVLRKYWKKVLPLFISIILLYAIIKTSVFAIFDVKSGSVAEMLSIPVQQIARVVKYHRNELDEETINKINKFFTCDNIGEKYNPTLSDPVKAELNDEYFNENKGEFISLWFNLLTRYFKDYVESFISNSYGYYYPEASHWVANRTMEPNNLGVEQTPIIKGTLVSKVDSLIERRDIPVLSMCFSIGAAFWLIVICVGYKIYIKEYKFILIYLPIFILWLTIVASPVFCEYRYAYSLFTSLPIFIGLNYIKKDDNEIKNSRKEE